MTDRDMTYGTGGAGRTRGAGRDTDELMETAQEKASQYSQKAQEKASDLGQRAQEQAEAGRERAAGGIDRAATQLREKASQQGGKTGEIGTKVADKLESTSDYLEQHDTGEIMDDIERYVREHPMQAVGAAVVGGFVLARILR